MSAEAHGDSERQGAQVALSSNDCYAISLLRALFAAPKFHDFIKFPREESTNEQKVLLEYLRSIEEGLYRFRHLPKPQTIGPFLSLLAGGKQVDVFNALKVLAEELDPQLFQIAFRVVFENSSYSDFTEYGNRPDENPSLTVQGVIDNWLNNGKQSMLPFKLPKILAVFLQAQGQEKRRRFDRTITLPAYKESDLDTKSFSSHAPDDGEREYNLVAVVLFTGYTKVKDGEGGHYVVVTRKPRGEKWELLDNSSDILSESTTVDDKEKGFIVLKNRGDEDAKSMTAPVGCGAQNAPHSTVPIYELSEGK